LQGRLVSSLYPPGFIHFRKEYADIQGVDTFLWVSEEKKDREMEARMTEKHKKKGQAQMPALF
jgi:hypothetical protein